MPLRKDTRLAKKAVKNRNNGDIKSVHGNLLLALELILLGSFFVATLLVPLYNLLLIVLG